MKLLVLGDQDPEKFEEYFEEVNQQDLRKVAPKIIDGNSTVDLGEHALSEYDAAFVKIPGNNPVFGRILLEMIEEKSVSLNYSSTAFFLSAKKNYLSFNLEDLNIPHPKTITLASAKAGRNAAKHIEMPVIAERFTEYRLTEKRLLDDEEEVQNFIEGTEYEDTVILLKEYREGDVYRSLVTGSTIVSLKTSSKAIDLEESEFKYSELPDSKKEIVKQTQSKIGIEVCEVVTRGEEVVDVNPNPDLEYYREKSGKDTYKEVAEVLKE